MTLTARQPDAVLTFSDRVASLSGQLVAADDMPATELTVVVFPTERRFWRPGSRRIRATRPGTDGRFTVTPLPGGEYMVVAIAAEIGAADLADPAVLEEFVPHAVRVVLAEGEARMLNLRVVR
jgi:hypothetical protein